MSTKQYQHFEDTNKAYEEAKAKMKLARKEFISLIRETGTDLRKRFVPDHDRTSLAFITTAIADYVDLAAPGAAPNVVPSAMLITIQPTNHRTMNYEIDQDEMRNIRDYLHSKGWAVKKCEDIGTHWHQMYCI